MTAVAQAANGDCCGFTDEARPRTAPSRASAEARSARQLQAKIFAANRLSLPVAASDLTVIWLGALSCPGYRADGVTCQDGREYSTEQQELQALQLSQTRTDLTGRLHVVIANAGADMRHAQDVARPLVAHRASFGRVVALGGGDSRAVTKAAVASLLAAGVPFIAPNLSSDDEGPGLLFLNTPSFLQMSPQA
jgi:hypothetical protein